MSPQVFDAAGQVADEPEQRVHGLGLGGFALIELLVVLAIIVALMQILVPTIHQVRKDANRHQAAAHLSAIHPCAVQFLQQTGHFPAQLADLAFCDVDRRVLAGESQGYRYLVIQAGRRSWRLAAEPARPGITGSKTMVLDQAGTIHTFPTPGAEQAEQEMFDKIQIAGAQAIGDLLALHPEAPGHAGGYSVDSFFDIFWTIDFDHDGLVTLVETLVENDRIRNLILGALQGPIRDAVNDFFDSLEKEMQLGAGGEDLAAIPGVEFRELRLEQPLIFSSEGLCRATRRLVVDRWDHLERSLCAKLTAAQEAEARGDRLAKDRLLDAYRRQVQAQAGRRLTYRAVMTLLTLSKTL